MTQRVTLNAGVRYDVEAYPTQTALNAEYVCGGARVSGSRRAYGCGPRMLRRVVGLAYDLRGDGKSVLRANYGIFYDRAPGNLSAQSSDLQLDDGAAGDRCGRSAMHGGEHGESAEPECDECVSGVADECELSSGAEPELSSGRAEIRSEQHELALREPELPRRRDFRWRFCLRDCRRI